MTAMPALRLRRSTFIAATVAASALAACAKATTAPRAPVESRITTGESLVSAMHARHADQWYRTLTFTQRTTQVPLQGGLERRSTWYESIMIPGRLRIDTDLAAGAGTLFANDSQYVVVNKVRRRAVAGYNTLLVFRFDVNAQPPARTAETLRSLGFPMTPVRDGSWQDRPVWIVGGTGPQDLHSPQFWVDKERLLFVRMLQPFPGDTTKTYDIRLSDFVPTNPGWVAITVESFVDDKRIQLEQYDDVKTDRPLSDALFDLTKWSTAPHWAKSR